MPRNVSRRQAIVVGTAALGTCIAASTSVAQVTEAQSPEETKSLDMLYQDALAEGGDLVVYAGGDVAAQQAAAKNAFLAQFPNMKLDMIVDYSKFHDVRIDNQLATNALIPDVVHLQTLQDFPRWKAAGHLLSYKPAGFSRIYEKFRDPDGTWMAVAVIAFSFMYDVAAVRERPPQSPKQLIDPEWRGKIASSYPNDDDAVLYLYRLYTEAYGWDWIAKLAAQNMQFARGTHTPGVAVNAHDKMIGLGGSASPIPTAPTKFVVPDGDPFLGWGQRAAIFKKARRPAAAKLYLNWLLALPRQQAAFNGWSVRTDVTPPAGLKPIWDYTNAHLEEFPTFMGDRAEAERWRQTFTLYFGEVRGDPSPGWLGLSPGG